jgi:pimeloyl-ACP methyl ester carboxylesterase
MENLMSKYSMVDHEGKRLVHGRPNVNGVNIHFAMGGSGDPIYLIHGVPKTMYFWHKLIPYLTPYYTVVAIDVRGYGESERPQTGGYDGHGGYDTRTQADDVAALATYLGHDTFRVAGDDWGAAISYAVSAFHRDRVKQLVFQEMLLPGIGYGESVVAGRTQKLKKIDTRTMWHLDFFNVPHYPEMLMVGKEREFWSYFMKREMWDPSAATDDYIEEQLAWLSDPGGTHTILQVYRANELDAEQNQTQFANKLKIPVLAVGGEAFFGDEVKHTMVPIAENVRGVVLKNCGHNPSLEMPDQLAKIYLDFFNEVK